MTLYLTALILVGAATAYMTPTIVAIARDHRAQGQIAALNLFLGWTFVGWLGALIWSLSVRRGVIAPSVAVTATGGNAYAPPPSR